MGTSDLQAPLLKAGAQEAVTSSGARLEMVPCFLTHSLPSFLLSIAVNAVWVLVFWMSPPVASLIAELVKIRLQYRRPWF